MRTKRAQRSATIAGHASKYSDSTMIVVPEAFAARRITYSGDDGRRWVEALPELIERLCAEWGLEVEAAQPLHGDLGLVVPVRRGHEPLMLKVGWVERATADEARALRAWNGHGAVRMFEARPNVGALLLERLDSRRSLRDLELFDAAEVAGGLLRRLAVPAPDGLRKSQDMAAGLAESLPNWQERVGNPVPPSWLEAARELARELAHNAADRLVHGDLHYDNVLAGEREPWLAVDPKPVAGDPEYAVPELLWTWMDEIDSAEGLLRLLRTLIENGDLDAEVARAWAVVRCTHYWLWGLANGLTIDPVRCRRILEVLVRPSRTIRKNRQLASYAILPLVPARRNSCKSCHTESG